MNRRSLTRRTSATIAIGLLAIVGYAGSSGATSSSTKQRVTIDARIPWALTGATFKLVPLTSEAIQRDSGEVLFSSAGDRPTASVTGRSTSASATRVRSPARTGRS